MKLLLGVDEWDYGLGRGFITWPIEGIVAFHIFDIPSKFITRAQRVREISRSLWDGEDHVLAVFWIADGKFAARGIDIPPLEAKEPRSAETSIYEQLHDDLAIIGKMPLNKAWYSQLVRALGARLGIFSRLRVSAGFEGIYSASTANLKMPRMVPRYRFQLGFIVVFVDVADAVVGLEILYGLGVVGGVLVAAESGLASAGNLGHDTRRHR
jgi:hypothetical protein